MNNVTNVAEVLSALRQAAREVKGDGGVAEAPWGPNTPSNTKQLLIQIASLHKGFLALSDAIQESIEASRQQSVAWDSSLEAVRRECLAKLELALTVQQDLQQLVTLEAGLQAQNAMLADRLGHVEEQAASLQVRLEQQGVEVGQAIRNQVTQAANAHFEEHVQHLEGERLQPLVQAALQRQVQQWAASELAGVVQEEVRRQAATAVQAALGQELQALQGGIDAAQTASVGAAELTSRTASDVAALAADVQCLTEWCTRVDAAHANHEQRLRLLEGASLGPAVAGAVDATAAGIPKTAEGTVEWQQQLAEIEAAQREQEWRLSRLEAGATRVGSAISSSPASAAAPHAAAAPATANPGPGAPGSCGMAEPGSGTREAAAAAATEVEAQLAAVEARLGTLLSEARTELAALQAQHARGTEEVVHSMLTDVMSLARHIKALDGEVRALRGSVGQVQDALLRCSGTFARALGIPSPVGPFTSFPPS